MRNRSNFICIVFMLSLVVAFATQSFAAATPYDRYQKYIPNIMPIQKRHLRGEWISTVVNLDWPSAATRDLINADERIQKSKEELIQILDKAVSMNMNAIFFQVSPEGDALYLSDIVPWSRYLTGTFGQDPGFDPLAFVIEQAHQRNLEVHAWFNPYRVSMNTNSQTTQSLAVPKSVYQEHPEWIKTSASRYVVDPGIPDARKWVINRVMEVVDRYDVDGVHFDDYFYYEGTISKLDDQETFKKYNDGAFTNHGDWRRNNTYLLIKELSDEIRRTKSWVKFGISPSGVWGEKSLHIDGSNTNLGYTNYDTAFADTKRWVEEEFIDYIAPQIYFTFANSRAAYGEVASWWAEVVNGKNTHLYIGQALYKVNDDSDGYFKGTKGLTEFSNQLKFNVVQPNISGSILFRAKNLTDGGKQQMVTTIQDDLWSVKALVPVMPWKGGKAPDKPTAASMKATADGIQLNWSNSDPDTAYYAIYRFEKGEKVNLGTNPAEKMIATVRNDSNGSLSYIDLGAANPDNVQYMITALDRLHNESEGVIVSTDRSSYFYDVGSNYLWAIPAIDEMYQQKIVLGDGTGRFYPGQNTKRGDFILMVVRALELYTEVDDNFDDVPADSYYYNGIAIAKKLGIAQGDGNNFSPEGNITREDMMVIVLRALATSGWDIELAGEEILEQYNDSHRISSYAKPAIASMTKSGYIQGSNSHVLPKNFATRAEITVLLHRILHR